MYKSCKLTEWFDVSKDMLCNHEYLMLIDGVLRETNVGILEKDFESSKGW